MHTPLFNRVTILGLGLIGSSIARALKQNKLTAYISAFDVNVQSIQYATIENSIDSHHVNAGQAAQHADLIIFATPPGTFETLAKDIAPFLKTGVIITDVASVKRAAITAIGANLPEGIDFVPAHPIAGSEKTGVQAGSADLFKGKRVILTPEEKNVMSEPVRKMRLFWEDIGAKIEYMPPELHDRMYAYVSHLPQWVAFAAHGSVNNLAPQNDEIFTRFKRLMHSNPELWADISFHNADFIGEAIAEFLTFGTQILGELSENKDTANSDAATLAKLFPKVIATCLIASVSSLEDQTGIAPVRYVGSGFNDMTASAMGEPDATLEAISHHNQALAVLLQATLEKLKKFKKALDTKDASALARLFAV